MENTNAVSELSANERSELAALLQQHPEATVARALGLTPGSAARAAVGRIRRGTLALVKQSLGRLRVKDV
jgi:hypothetical protein